MSFHRSSRTGLVATIATALAVTIAPLAVGIGSAPAAQAATPNAVVVGDSLPANPTLADYFTSRSSAEVAQLLTPTGRVNEIGCGTDFYFTNVYAAVSGKPTGNYTCPGASFFTGGRKIWEQLDAAAQRGELGPHTADVVIFAGANDIWPRLAQGQALPDIEHEIYRTLRAAIDQAHRLAPNARVKVTGVPSISNDQGGVCILNVIPNLPMGIPAGVVTQAEDALQRAQQAAAHDSGATYVNSREISRGHDTCSNDRWIAGIVDTTVKSPQTLMLHMTQHAIEELATATVRS